MTQTEDILYQLRRRDAVCGTELLEAHIPRYAARISELRGNGYNIITEPCTQAQHRHQSRQIQYRLLAPGAML